MPDTLSPPSARLLMQGPLAASKITVAQVADGKASVSATSALHSAASGKAAAAPKPVIKA